jgi:septal ring factor EnvC (AmiA/AmiB activator)
MKLTTQLPRPAWPRSARPLLTGWLLGTVLLTATLAGCAPAPELDRDAARQLQSTVLAVTETAAANDPSASLKRLDELVLKLDEAAARGEVSFKRHQSIRKSVDSVRADLTARQAEAARVAAEKEAAAQAAAAAAAAAAQAEADAAAAAAQAPPPAVAPAPPAGKGKGKGKGDK